MSSTITVIVIVGAIAVAAGIYLAKARATRRSSGVSSTTATLIPGAVEGRRRDSTHPADTLDPKTLGMLRAGREGDRLTEDEIARQKMGARGRPGEPSPAYDLGESETQMPKPLDPGHTA